MPSDAPTLVLASGSPRRADLLTQLGVDFVRRPVDVDETPHNGEQPVALVRRLGTAKAQAEVQAGEVVLAADTIVVLDDRILGKPRSVEEAESMLADLSGRTHTVYTGVAVATAAGSPAVDVAATEVSIIALDLDTIARYVATGEPLDKAGAYAVQGLGAAFVDRIEGSYTNVVGLPLTLTRRMLAPHGIDLPNLAAADA